MAELKGINPVVITPFDKEGNVDCNALKNHVNNLINSGVHGIIPTGSTGEFAALTEDEHKKVIAVTVEEVNGRVPVIAGTAAVSTKQTIKMTAYAKEVGCDAAMIVAPYYCHPNDQEIYGHYKALSESVDITYVLYNNPGTSGVDMEPELIAKLAKLKNLDYLKESTGDMSRVAEIQRLAGDDIKIFCGCDTLSMEMLMMGAVGWVAPPANIIPELCVELYNLTSEKKDYVAAKELYFKLLPLFTLFESSGQYIQLTKAGLDILGRGVGAPRLPLLPPSDDNIKKLEKILKNLV